MTELDAWLEEREAGVPESLVERMRVYLVRRSGAVPDRLAHAALDALRAALERPDERASALDLLTADALLTAAFEAAAEEGAATVDRLAAAMAPAAFAELLTEPS
jgi:pyruvate carboxylase